MYRFQGLVEELFVNHLLVPPAHDQQALAIHQRILRQLLQRLVQRKHLGDLRRELMQAIDDLVPPLRQRDLVFRQLQGHHDERDVLRRVRLARCRFSRRALTSTRYNTHLGRSHTDFRTSVDVDTAVGLTGHGASDGVHDTDAERTTLQAVPHGQDRVGRLAGLGDEHADVVTEDRCLAIQEIGGQLDGYGDLRQFLKDSSCLSHCIVSPAVQGRLERRLTATAE